jgi:hypothetical protein
MAADVIALLDAHVDSIEALDVVLLVRQYGWQRLSREFVARRTGRDIVQVAQVIGRLAQSGLVTIEPAEPESFRLVGASDVLTSLDELAQTYADDPLGIVTYVSTRSMERMRTRAARFAARIRRDHRDD